jgi:hypothetical protein
MSIFNYCSHIFGDIKDGYQYCTKCNMAITRPPKKVCGQHKWKIIKEKAICDGSLGNIVGHFYILQCENCGIITDEQRQIENY